ncbi:VOC family protein [Paracidovorax konjaci]|uniref:VOC family protein n=1 Tax=Paracidovorax konjaci TaxID=32040 RepID=UPI001113957C|nr:hypothetical protein [Paracidovorax konjaci]
MKFYVSELSLFKIASDYGMGSYLLVANENPSLGLQISPGDSREISPRPLFTIAVQEIDSLFQRLKDLDFSSGAELLTKESFFDYPAGKSMSLKDPGGNILVIEQPYFD